METENEEVVGQDLEVGLGSGSQGTRGMFGGEGTALYIYYGGSYMII